MHNLHHENWQYWTKLYWHNVNASLYILALSVVQQSNNQFTFKSHLLIKILSYIPDALSRILYKKLVQGTCTKFLAQ